MNLKTIAKYFLANFHFFLAKSFGHKENEVSDESLNHYFESMGYKEIPYLEPKNPLLNSTKDLSFIIPVYNCEQFLGYCLDTILKQKTKYSYEVICVNDGSKDRSWEVLQDYAKNYPDLIVAINQPNGGASVARNTGIDHAKGEYLAFVDSDDFVFDNYIEKLMCAAKSNDADIVQAGYHRVLPDHSIIDSNPRNACIFDIFEQKKAFDNVSGYLWSGVIRKKMFDKVRFPIGYWFEDMMTRSIIMRRAKKFAIIADCLYGYTCNPTSLSSVTWDSHKIKCLDQVFLAKIFQDYGKRVLELEDDSLSLSVLLVELSKMGWTRMKYQPEDIKRKAFLKIHNIVKSFSCGIRPLTTELGDLYQAILANDYFKWKHLCIYLNWCNIN